MEKLSTYSETIKAWARRCAARADDPEFQRQAAISAQQDAEFEKRQAENDRNLTLLRAGVPMSLWKAVEKPNVTDAMKAVGEFLAAGPELVFCTLAGPKGRGKTFALCWAVAHRGGRFVEAQDMVSTGTFDRDFWLELEDARVLALDELGAEYPNAAFEASLYSLLNKRYQNQRKTIIGTNLDANGFRARYGSNGLDRLAERMRIGGVWVNLPGESMRTSAAQAREPGQEG